MARAYTIKQHKQAKTRERAWRRIVGQHAMDIMARYACNEGASSAAEWNELKALASANWMSVEAVMSAANEVLYDALQEPSR